MPGAQGVCGGSQDEEPVHQRRVPGAGRTGNGAVKTDDEWARARDGGGGPPLPLARFLSFLLGFHAMIANVCSVSHPREQRLWGDRAISSLVNARGWGTAAGPSPDFRAGESGCGAESPAGSGN